MVTVSPSGSTTTAVTYTPIATYSLLSDTATIDFTSITGTYKDLVLVGADIQTDNTGSSYNAVQIKLNNDTSNLYSFTSIEGDGTTATSNRDSNDRLYVGFAPQTSATTKGNLIMSLMNYSNTTTYKTVLTRSNAAAFGTQARVSLYRSTSAITQITVFFTGTVKYKTGTTFTLYGIGA